MQADYKGIKFSQKKSLIERAVNKGAVTKEEIEELSGVTIDSIIHRQRPYPYSRRVKRKDYEIFINMGLNQVDTAAIFNVKKQLIQKYIADWDLYPVWRPSKEKLYKNIENIRENKIRDLLSIIHGYAIKKLAQDEAFAYSKVQAYFGNLKRRNTLKNHNRRYDELFEFFKACYNLKSEKGKLYIKDAMKKSNIKSYNTVRNIFRTADVEYDLIIGPNKS